MMKNGQTDGQTDRRYNKLTTAKGAYEKKDDFLQYIKDERVIKSTSHITLVCGHKTKIQSSG